MQTPCLLSCFLFFFFVFFTPQLSFSCPQDQRQSLLDFKNLLAQNIKNLSTAETTLGGLETWRPNSDCCKWQLVRCDARSPFREVIDLNLNSLVLSGSVSSSLLSPSSLHLRKLAGFKDDGGKKVNAITKHIVGSPRYLTAMRPDITNDVSIISRYMENPSESHSPCSSKTNICNDGVIDLHKSGPSCRYSRFCLDQFERAIS